MSGPSESFSNEQRTSTRRNRIWTAHTTRVGSS